MVKKQNYAVLELIIPDPRYDYPEPYSDGYFEYEEPLVPPMVRTSSFRAFREDWNEIFDTIICMYDCMAHWDGDKGERWFLDYSDDCQISFDRGKSYLRYFDDNNNLQAIYERIKEFNNG